MTDEIALMTDIKIILRENFLIYYLASSVLSRFCRVLSDKVK